MMVIIILLYFKFISIIIKNELNCEIILIAFNEMKIDFFKPDELDCEL